jgi:hypothetical protein
MTPGLQFFAEQIDPIYPATGLYPTMSTYGILDLEGGPKRNELYVVCRDWSIQSVYEPERSIGWELIEDGDDWFYRVTQMNHPRKRCAVRYHSRVDDPPAGRGSIGSVVRICRRVEDPPQNAEIIEQKDDDPEVSSECPGAPKKPAKSAEASDLEKISRNLDPLLAQCAVIVGDPVQTAAMARFAEGKMSYAEMRSLCG